MSRRVVGQFLAIVAGVAAQAMLGWWALALVGFVAGVIYRRHAVGCGAIRRWDRHGRRRAAGLARVDR